MSLFKDKRKRTVFIAVTAAALTVAIIVGAVCAYVCDYYRADEEAIGAFLPEGAEWNEKPCGTIVFQPDNARKGLIFYPGGKVENDAYIPLMQACAQRGILCVMVEMPFNLAVLDINSADGIREEYPEIESWYIGGHSLGGSMAALYLADHHEEFDGLVLLGSYSTEDLSKTELDVLSVYGSEDGVLDFEKYDENRKNLPADFSELVIEGGCHAFFGMYGPQDGDGTPTVSNGEQIELTAAAIAEMVEKTEG